MEPESHPEAEPQVHRKLARQPILSWTTPSGGTVSVSTLLDPGADAIVLVDVQVAYPEGRGTGGLRVTPSTAARLACILASVVDNDEMADAEVWMDEKFDGEKAPGKEEGP